MPYDKKPVEVIQRDIEQLNRMIITLRRVFDELKGDIKFIKDYIAEQKELSNKGWFY